MHPALRIATAMVGAFFSAGAYWMFLPLLSVALRAKGVDDFWVGIISALPWIGLLAISGFVPRVTRRLGLQRMVLTGICITIFVFLGFAATGKVWVWSLLCLVMGGAVALRWAGLDTWMNGSFPAHLRGRLTGVYELILGCSMALGPALVAIAGNQGALPFLFGAGVTAFAACLLLLAGREAGAEDEDEDRPARQRDILRQHRPAFIGIFLVGFTEACNLSLLPLYGLSDGFSVHLSALMAAAVQAGAAAGAIGLGVLADHMDRHKLRDATAIIMAIMPLGLALPLHQGLWPWLFVWGMAQGGMFTLGIVFLASRYAGLGLASAMSLSMVVYTLGGIAGPPLLGLCMSMLGATGFALGLALVAVMGLVALLRAGARQKHLA